MLFFTWNSWINNHQHNIRASKKNICRNKYESSKIIRQLADQIRELASRIPGLKQTQELLNKIGQNLANGENVEQSAQILQNAANIIKPLVGWGGDSIVKEMNNLAQKVNDIVNQKGKNKYKKDII